LLHNRPSDQVSERFFWSSPWLTGLGSNHDFLDRKAPVKEGGRHGNPADFRVSFSQFEKASRIYIITAKMQNSFWWVPWSMVAKKYPAAGSISKSSN
jgi:hypothetical protein